MYLELLFENIYHNAIVLREAKVFMDADAIIDAIKDGTMIKLLNGKKNLPAWLKDDVEKNQNIPEIRQCFSKVLNAVSTNINNGINETIYLLIKKSSSLDEMKTIVQTSLDFLIAYALTIKAQWSKDNEFLKAVHEQPYNHNLWDLAEKDLLRAREERLAKKHKGTINNSDDYTTLYEDSTWGLYVPKNQAADSKLASNIEPFEYDGRTFNKTRWCTAASQYHYDSYSNKGKNVFYVIKYFVNGKYTEAWQIAFYMTSSVEIMDKTDCRNYDFLLENAPDALLEKIVCDNELNNELTFKDFKYANTKDIDEFFAIPHRSLWYLYIERKKVDISLDDFTQNWESDLAKEKGFLAADVENDDIQHIGIQFCLEYSRLKKKYPEISQFTIGVYSPTPAMPWEEWLAALKDNTILPDIDVYDFLECGETTAKKYTNLVRACPEMDRKKFTLRKFCSLDADGERFAEIYTNWRNEGKCDGIPFDQAVESYHSGIDPDDVLDYLQAISDNRCLPFPKHIFGPIAYRNCPDKAPLEQAARDAKAGLIPTDILPTIYTIYKREDVINFYRLAQQGAFDDTATLKQFVEYGAENLNDINVLKHQKRLWPTFTIEDCFQVGADKALAISKELYDNNCSKDVTIEDYYTYGAKILGEYAKYKTEFPDAYFTENLEVFDDTYHNPAFKFYLDALVHPEKYKYDYKFSSIDEFIDSEDDHLAALAS